MLLCPSKIHLVLRYRQFKCELNQVFRGFKKSLSLFVSISCPCSLEYFFTFQTLSKAHGDIFAKIILNYVHTILLHRCNGYMMFLNRISAKKGHIIIVCTNVLLEQLFANYPTTPFTILGPQEREMPKFYFVQEHGTSDFRSSYAMKESIG